MLPSTLMSGSLIAQGRARQYNVICHHRRLVVLEKSPKISLKMLETDSTYQSPECTVEIHKKASWQTSKGRANKTQRHKRKAETKLIKKNFTRFPFLLKNCITVGKDVSKLVSLFHKICVHVTCRTVSNSNQINNARKSCPAFMHKPTD